MVGTVVAAAPEQGAVLGVIRAALSAGEERPPRGRASGSLAERGKPVRFIFYLTQYICNITFNL